MSAASDSPRIVYKHSAGGVVIHNGKIVTIHSDIRGSVSLPKGTIDPGESPETAAVREVKEETGYDVEIMEKIGDYTFEFDWKDGARHIKTVSYYLMKRANDEPPQQSLQEGEDFVVNWLDEAAALRSLTFDEARDAVTRGLDMLAK